MDTIILILEALIFVGIMYLINAWVGNGKHSLTKYLTAFLLILGVLFAFRGKAYASEYEQILDRYVYDYNSFSRNSFSENEESYSQNKCISLNDMPNIIMSWQKVNAGGYQT